MLLSPCALPQHQRLFPDFRLADSGLAALGWSRCGGLAAAPERALQLLKSELVAQELHAFQD